MTKLCDEVVTKRPAEEGRRLIEVCAVPRSDFENRSIRQPNGGRTANQDSANDGIEVDDHRPVDAAEASRIKALLKLAHGRPMEGDSGAGMDLDVIAGRLDPVDGCRHRQDLRNRLAG